MKWVFFFWLGLLSGAVGGHVKPLWASLLLGLSIYVGSVVITWATWVYGL